MDQFVLLSVQVYELLIDPRLHALTRFWRRFKVLHNRRNYVHSETRALINHDEFQLVTRHTDKSSNYKR